MKRYTENVLDLIGNTPLLKLQRVTKNVRPTILAKLEFLNPGGSVKDRIGIAMLREAAHKGAIKKGGTVVEPSSGNTGVALALACITMGFRLIVTMPDKMSGEKKSLLEAYGAKVVVCPTNVHPGDSRHYVSVAQRISKDLQTPLCQTSISTRLIHKRILKPREGKCGIRQMARLIVLSQE